MPSTSTASPFTLSTKRNARLPSIEAFSLAQYGRPAEMNQSTLDAALSSARSAAGRVKAQHSLFKMLLQRFTPGAAAAAESRA